MAPYTERHSLPSTAVRVVTWPWRPRGVHPEHRPHPQPEIEGTRVHEQPLEHVLVPADVRASQSTGLVQMRTWSLEQFTAFPKEPFSAIAADPTSIRIDRVAFCLLINPRLWPAIRLT